MFIIRYFTHVTNCIITPRDYDKRHTSEFTDDSVRKNVNVPWLRWNAGLLKLLSCCPQRGPTRLWKYRVSTWHVSRKKKGTQSTYNVILRRVRESLLQRKSNKYYIFVWVYTRVRACARARGRMHARDVALLIQHATRPIFLASHKRHDFRGGGGGFFNIKCVFWFSLQLLSEKFLILRII
jgi:hypothetical protein